MKKVRIGDHDYERDGGGFTKTLPARPAEARTATPKELKALLQRKMNNLAIHKTNLVEAQARIDRLTQEVADLKDLLAP